ncbi:hypothetical protein [Chitinophaga caseinilytica]|jgi:hypothetical protein|uniref:Uncharacterized protein n=1 Tax=Chitinophaga caseinilytica TaxID=2267521 RepID=A0ABZ2Z225_9BACT
MKTLLFISISTLILTGVGVLWYKLSRSKRDIPPEISMRPHNTAIIRKSELNGKMIVDSLDAMGYFRFTHPSVLDSLKKEIETAYDEYGILSSTYDEQTTFRPHCNRLYSCDGETLYETGGLEEMLKDVKPTFDQLHVPLQWADEYWADDATLHTIVLNGKKYEAFKGDPQDSYCWGYATRNFVNILNDQLALHNAEDRVYPIMYGNDGRIVFLTPSQFDFIQRHFRAEMPRTVESWWNEGTR